MNEETKNQLNDLRKRLPIDPFDLETECVNQPVMYAEVGELATEARSTAKLAKDKLEYTKADLSFKIRKEPGKYGVEKITEASVEAAVTLQPEYQTVSTAVIEAQRIADSFGILQESVGQRKSMIRDLVTLFVFKYYSTQHEMGQDKHQVGEVSGEVTKEEILKKRAELAEHRGRSDEVKEEQE